ncbi:MAG: hypothetical protein N2422_05895 [Rhodobacteraceae bacterium]|nr:hypothetical protein [Paracoccaceae bacterium]
MNAVHFEAGQPLLAELRGVIRRHGAIRVILAMGVALLRPVRHPRTIRPDELPDHLRRDIGLPPRTEVASLRGLSARCGSGLP